MTDLNLEIVSDFDDVYVKDGLSEIQTSQLITAFGKVTADGSPYTRASGLRFQNVAIPRGSIIDRAYITVRAWTTQASTVVRAKLRGEAADNPALFSTYADFAGRPRTSAGIDWDIDSIWASGTNYDSPDISAVIQEIVNRNGWDSGNSLVVFIEDDGSDTNVSRNVLAARTATLFINCVAFGARRPSDAIAAEPIPGTPGARALSTPPLPVARASTPAVPDWAPISRQPSLPPISKATAEGAPVSSELPIVADLDDAFTVSVLGLIFTTADYLRFGRIIAGASHYTCHSGIRFQNIPILQGSEVGEAVITLRASHDLPSTTVRLKIYGEDTDNPTQFSTYANFIARSRTTASVDWDIGEAWTLDTDYASPDVSEVIQEIVSRSGWSKGNSLVVFIENDGSDAEAHRNVWAYPATPPVLSISFGRVVGLPTDEVEARGSVPLLTGRASTPIPTSSAKASTPSIPDWAPGRAPGHIPIGRASRQQE